MRATERTVLSKAHQAHPHRSAVDHPRLVAPRLEDRAAAPRRAQRSAPRRGRYRPDRAGSAGRGAGRRAPWRRRRRRCVARGDRWRHAPPGCSASGLWGTARSRRWWSGCSAGRCRRRAMCRAAATTAWRPTGMAGVRKQGAVGGQLVERVMTVPLPPFPVGAVRKKRAKCGSRPRMFPASRRRAAIQSEAGSYLLLVACDKASHAPHNFDPNQSLSTDLQYSRSIL